MVPVVVVSVAPTVPSTFIAPATPPDFMVKRPARGRPKFVGNLVEGPASILVRWRFRIPAPGSD